MKQFWLYITRSPYVVAAYSAAFGAIVSYLNGAIVNGSFDFSAIKWERMAAMAATAAFIAIVHLMTPAPGTNPKA